MTISGFGELRARLKEAEPVEAVVAAAGDTHTLEAVYQASRDGLVNPVLVGDVEQIQRVLDALGWELSGDRVVEAGDEAACAQRAVALVRENCGQMLVKGMLQTKTLLREVVRPDTGIRAERLLSHVAILDVPAYHKLLFLTDGGMVIAPNLEEKREILKNALSLCRFLGYEQPKAAILCATETVDGHMPETEDAAVLKSEGERGDFGSCLIEGPISFDLATDLEAAKLKGYHSPVAGDADILVVPNIAAGNLLGKSLYGMAGGDMAGVVLGAQVPITVNSRSASPEEKYDSIAIAAAMAHFRAQSIDFM